MAGSSIIVALNAVALKRLRLPDPAATQQPPPVVGARDEKRHDVPATGAA
jgi:hypothetical protein